MGLCPRLIGQNPILALNEFNQVILIISKHHMGLSMRKPINEVFPIRILGQVWYLNVSIPDLCTLTYFVKINPAYLAIRTG